MRPVQKRYVETNITETYFKFLNQINFFIRPESNPSYILTLIRINKTYRRNLPTINLS